MKRNTKLVFLMLMLVFVLLLSACKKVETGIQGQVFLADCYGDEVGVDCTAIEPYQAILTIYDADLVMLKTVETEEDGTFITALDPGTYFIHPQNTGLFPIATDFRVDVSEGVVLELTIHYDSGAR